MKSIYAIYTQEVYANLRPLHATWEPTQLLNLGDVGILDGRSFRKQSDLRSLRISFSSAGGSARPNIWFSSNGSTTLNLKPAVTAGPGVLAQEAEVDLSFNCSGAVFFHAAGCKSIQIKNRQNLGQQVIKKFEQGDWNPDWVVVTELIKANGTTIAIAQKRNGSLQLNANVASPTIDLTRANIKLSLKGSQGIGFQLVSDPGLTPLFGLSKLSNGWFSGPDFRPAMIGDSGESAESGEPEWDFIQIS